jgi:hypothetical protein
MRRILAILCTVAPFVAAGVAAFSARHDLRIAWMALVTTLVARLIAALAQQRSRTFSAGISVAIGTIAAAAVALVAGAHAPFGIIAVALVLAAFSSAGVWLGVPPTTSRATDPGAAV